jgi:hypothetical protein
MNQAVKSRNPNEALGEITNNAFSGRELLSE